MIIGISGVARSGKDTFANLLHNRLMYRTRAFAKNLKKASQVIFGFTDEQVYGDSKELIDPYWGFTPRWALQYLGTDLCREQLDEAIWVRSTMRPIDENRPLSDKWVITDVRFRNEAMAIHRRGGIVVRIERGGAGASSGIVHHASEDLSDVPYNVVVPNNGTIDDLIPWVTAVSTAVTDCYAAQVGAAAAFVEDGGVMGAYKLRLATNNHFIPLPDNYLRDLVASPVYLGDVHDLEFMRDVEHELSELRATS